MITLPGVNWIRRYRSAFKRASRRRRQIAVRNQKLYVQVFGQNDPLREAERRLGHSQRALGGMKVNISRDKHKEAILRLTQRNLQNSKCALVSLLQHIDIAWIQKSWIEKNWITNGLQRKCYNSFYSTCGTDLEHIYSPRRACTPYSVWNWDPTA